MIKTYSCPDGNWILNVDWDQVVGAGVRRGVWDSKNWEVQWFLPGEKVAIPVESFEDGAAVVEEWKEYRSDKKENP